MPKTRFTRDAIGIDFGTTNSAVALALAGVPVQFATFPSAGQELLSSRSLVYFEQVRSEGGAKRTLSLTGAAAIERYRDAEDKGRLIQSLKSHLANRMLTGTEVFGRRHKLEELISGMLGDLRRHAGDQFGRPVTHAMVGRPVHFVGADTDEDAEFAVSRLRAAFIGAGFDSVEFEFEPVAAAYAYESTLDHDELILIGDFGGGTSDFSLLRVGPGVRSRGRTAKDMLGNAGLALAGDAFDSRIVRKLVSPALGSESEGRSLTKLMPAVPAWIYANLERWHYLSFLRTNNAREILQGARKRAVEPEKIDSLIAIIEEDLGYQLHEAVQQMKFELSQNDAAEFRFRDGGLDIKLPVTRTEFETWIAEDLSSIGSTVDTLLDSAGVDVRDVDRVFLTGGSSFVPAVRRIFAGRFGEEKIHSRNEFTSVAHGLALRAAEVQKDY
jgi:hypothetical chaperone protein